MSTIFYCYATPTDIDTGHTVTFDSFVNLLRSQGNQLRTGYLLIGNDHCENPIDWQTRIMTKAISIEEMFDS